MARLIKTICVAAIAVSCFAISLADEAWDPRKADLLFVSNKSKGNEIYIKKGGSDEWIQLTDEPKDDNWPEWSPDGKRILFQSKRSGNLDLWVMNADGSEQQQMTKHPRPDHLPSWTSDGKISFISWRRQRGEEKREPHVYVMQPNGKELFRLAEESPGTNCAASWAPDGSFWAITSKESDAKGNVFLLDNFGEVVRQLTDDKDRYNGAPSISPNGKLVAYYSEKGTNSKLMVVNVDGTGRRTILDKGRNWQPRWSPDSRWLVYTTLNPDGEETDLDIMAVPIDGSSEPIMLAGGPGREVEGRWQIGAD